MTDLKIQVLVDNPDSWIIPYAREMVNQLQQSGNHARLLHRHQDVTEGDILCLLACEKIFKKLSLNKHNLVVHESDLPKGKGWSPVTWQVLEGKSKIPVTLFEASEAVDEGSIYKKEYILLDGTELLPQIKHKQGITTQKLILDFVEKFPEVEGKKQSGNETFYSRRVPKDSELDVNKSLAEQFNLLRVCDNERYPAHFVHRNHKYIIKIYRKDDQEF